MKDLKTEDGRIPTAAVPGTDSIVTVLQGEYRLSGDPNLMMTTLLGSCVATCIWDPVAGVGGMNHFLLPGEERDRGGHLRFGVNAMELLLNGLIKHGARRDRLQVKLFGGARMLDRSSSIGENNVAFAKWFLENEGLPLEMSCVGGTRGRKLRFWPATGRAQRMFIADCAAMEPDEQAPRPYRAPARRDHGGEVELF